MSQFERVYHIDRLLRGRVAPDKQRLLSVLEVSAPTLKRDLEYMRSRLGAPIVWDRACGGYRYDSGAGDFSLPGLWFSGDEIHALLLVLHILDQLQPSFLRDQVQPFRGRLEAMVRSEAGDCEAISRRVSLIAQPSRISNPAVLDLVVRATLSRRRIRMTYRTRSRQSTTDRDISPGRLVYYRGNWYLDAWCHRAEAIRRFAVDAIGEAAILPERAEELPEMCPQDGYGIFQGPAAQVAVLRFAPAAADWVRTSQWHPDQELTAAADGGVVLRVPYSDDRELLMDILRHGSEVEVLAPNSLRRHIAETLRAAAAQYTVSRRPAAGARVRKADAAAS